MSFLAGRLAGQEGAYFLQESKQAVSRLVEKQKLTSKTTKLASKTPTSNESSSSSLSSSSDVLPEVLKHSLPSKIFKSDIQSSSASSSSSLSTASKWVLQTDSKNPNYVSPDALNPLRAYVSLPQVTFGPKRWQFPNAENSTLASTANELRRDKYTPVNAEKLKAAAIGLSQIAKAFAVATAAVFGGATLAFGLAASKLELHNIDDIRTKGKDLVHPRFDTVKEKVVPLRTWAENMSKKWHLEREENVKEKPLIKELSKVFGANTSN